MTRRTYHHSPPGLWASTEHGHIHGPQVAAGESLRTSRRGIAPMQASFSAGAIGRPVDTVGPDRQAWFTVSNEPLTPSCCVPVVLRRVRQPSQLFRFSRPLIRPESIFPMTSISERNCRCWAPPIKPRRWASSINGIHSWAEPRAIVKKFLRSALVNRPLPSARLVEMETLARFS